MRFYGIPSEDRVVEIVNSINSSGAWIFEDNGEKYVLNSEEVKAKLLELVEKVKEWKASMKHIPAGTTLIFVHEPSEPKAFKIYDLSSLGCAVSLNPPRWKVYIKELEAQMSP